MALLQPLQSCKASSPKRKRLSRTKVKGSSCGCDRNCGSRRSAFSQRRAHYVLRPCDCVLTVRTDSAARHLLLWTDDPHEQRNFGTSYNDKLDRGSCDHHNARAGRDGDGAVRPIHRHHCVEQCAWNHHDLVVQANNPDRRQREVHTILNKGFRLCALALVFRLLDWVLGGVVVAGILGRNGLAHTALGARCLQQQVPHDGQAARVDAALLNLPPPVSKRQLPKASDPTLYARAASRMAASSVRIGINLLSMATSSTSPNLTPKTSLITGSEISRSSAMGREHSPQRQGGLEFTPTAVERVECKVGDAFGSCDTLGVRVDARRLRQHQQRPPRVWCAGLA